MANSCFLVLSEPSWILFVNCYNIMAMIKHKTIILLTVLMCFSPMSGLFTVICHGANGHIAVEPVLHNHGEYPESDGSGHQKNSSESGIDLSSGHSHCRDSLATSSLVIFVRKNIKPQHVQVFEQNSYQKSISDRMIFSFELLSPWDAELSSFFTLLRTIVLLV